MKTTKTSKTKFQRRRRGLALIEVLICSTIAAMLLTATAVAYRSSIMVYRDNTDRDMLLSEGRIAMRQLISEIRQADAHGPINDTLVPNATTLFSQGQTVENTGIQILKEHPDADDPAIVYGNAASYVLLTWQYDSVNRQLVRTHSLGGTLTSAVMASYITDFKVSSTPARSAANIAAGNPTYDLLHRAVVTMTMQDVDSNGKLVNNQGSTLVTERIIDAAVPRRNFSDIN